ncbi:amino acid adenylation domain-containing protein/non-ribosomal peptide synthase protein (TIGR01720 family) [Croceifilum oryzae]|uniref:Amino acid adenylation domain-containing protein/non-ribosomal peptide synthase protein (TIGR01720 family) n=1 Tax=Croceifilum oryzae TaxID=1553429 RepID=A0AAJ1TLX9_9BACL|nr:non-ribosomal peptide synthetase [Croceifilum oryzae]MDQ0418594.1 amino acid adenylation domain-containing protein/non-ribosomal peptide synthase protein (TIGR01720 family) [Croceifilum oryzae]
MRSDLLAKLSSLSPEKREWLQKQMQKKEKKESLPLSYAQQRLWFMDQFHPNSSLYNIPTVWRLRGNWVPEVLERSFNRLVERHDSLRTVFKEVEDQPVQHVVEFTPQKRSVEDCSHLSLEEKEKELESLISREAKDPFDLVNGPLIRNRLVQVEQGEWLLLCTMHHIISDAWSIGILIQEWLAFYEEEASGSPAGLSPLVIQYSDYAKWQKKWLQGEVLDRQLTYWQEELSGELPILQLPMDRPRPAMQTYDGDTYRVILPHTKLDLLKAVSKQEGSTLFMTLMAAYQSFLARYTGQEDILVGSPIANRNHKGVEGLIGFFVNTLVYRADLSGAPTFREILSQVKKKALKAYDHQDVPFEKVVEALQPERSTSHSPIFQTMLTLQNTKPERIELSGRSLEMIESSLSIAKFDLSLTAYEVEEGLFISFEYNTDLFDTSTITRMAGHFENWLSEIAQHPDESFTKLTMLSDIEKKQLMEEWNDTGVAYGHEYMIHELFEEQVARTPEAVAIVHEGGQLTYQELNEKANQVAHYLQKRGVGPESLVGICVERSPEMMIGLFGILKAGGAYVPLDPGYPEIRLRYILQNSQIEVILTKEALMSWLPDDIQAICLDRDQETIAQESCLSPVSDVTANNLAYIIYTSGSTGNPKGVMIEHHSVINRIQWMQKGYPLSAQDTILQKTPFSFDVSVWELFWWSWVGARVSLLPPGGEKDPAMIEEFIERHRVTTMHFVPSMLSTFLDYMERSKAMKDVSSLQQVFTSGEALNTEQARRFKDEFYDPQQTKLINLYGPTEATVDVTYYDCKLEKEPTLIPIGRPIDNTELYVLDQNQQVVPIGVAGELYLGGVGLARGYFNRPDLTAERFIPHPFKEGERLYRTGDLARYLVDRNVEYIGRIDNQVKIRGFRIELGEIEAILHDHSSVKEALVLVREDQPGDKRLVAYVVGEGSIGAWRDHLKSQLPNYMVPAHFVELDEMPLTPNGKIDRKALPKPVGQSVSEDMVLPRTPAEELVASVWSQVLGVEGISVYDSFFERGGHSLLATQVVSRLQEAFQIEIPLRELFEYSTVEALAKRLDQLRQGDRKREIPPLMPVERGETSSLSYAQQRLWFVDQFMPNSTLYNMPMVCRLTGNWMPEALERGWNQLIERHESLRTVFREVEGHPVQQIQPYAFRVLPHMDLTKLSPEEREAEVKCLIQKETKVPFDLAEGPLLRGTILRVGEEEWILLCTLHHIVSDGWSMGVLLQEWMAFYEEATDGKVAELEPLPIQYADFAQWQKGWLKEEVLQQQVQYWKEELSGELPVLQLPMDRPRPAMQTHNGSTHTVVLPHSLRDKLNELSRQEGSTLFMTLLAGYQSFLSRYTGQEDIVVGSPIANRNYREIEGLIGFFVNTLVYRADLSGAPTFQDLLSQVRQKALKAYEYQDIPFEKVVEAVQPERSTSHSPIFQTMFILQNMKQEFPVRSGRRIAMVDSDNPIAKFDLSLMATETEEGLSISFEYNTDLFDVTTIERMAGHFENWLHEVSHQPQKPLHSLNMLSEAERERLLNTWNDTAMEMSQTGLICDEIETQVAKRPDAIAIVDQTREWTYAELDAQANQLAHVLQRKGVAPESVVGVYMSRSAELMASLVGILKAGGAYVVLDPLYPTSRLQYMIEDAGIQIVVTTAGQESLSEQVDTVRFEELSGESEVAPERDVKPENLAYIVYTSGSTGKPKGVMIEYRSLMNMVYWHQEAYQITGEDRATQIAGIAFDSAVQEIWPYLTAGAALYLTTEELRVNPEALRDWIVDSGITASFAPTPILERLLKCSWPAKADLRFITTGGDQLTQFPTEQIPFAVINQYGPSENTVVSTDCYVPVGLTTGTPTIGRPIANTEVYVLDTHLEPVPVGVIGDLYLGGKSLARGYANRPELTEEKFIPHPFKEGERLYYTGDKASYLANGELQFHGRMDDQVKIRGFRIELGEVEATLQAHSAVKEAVVLVREDQPGDKRLVAYVVGEGSVAQWREHLQIHLPNYMVPTYFVEMESLPLTPNGKLDLRALPTPDRQSSEEIVHPRTASEEWIASVWIQVLGIEEISVHDSFFERGGHSLLATQVVSRLQEALQIQIPVRELFEYPTLVALAQRLDLLQKEEKGREIPSLRSIERGETIPLSYAQQRLWFIDQFTPNSALYNIPMVCRLTGNWASEALEIAWNQLIERHESLRTVFHDVDGHPIQQIQPYGFQSLPMIDLTHVSPEERERNMQQWIQNEVEAPFNLEKGPLIRGKIVQIAADEWMLLCTMHHIISDGWSMDILLQEWMAFYEEAADGKLAELAPLPVQYADFAQWQREWLTEEVLDQQLAYWQKELSGELPVLTLPMDRPRPVVQTNHGATHSVLFPQSLLERVKDVSQQEGSTLFMTLLAAYQGFLSRYTGQDDILVGSPIANRNNKEIEGLIGFFVNTLVYRADLSEKPTFRELLSQVREKALKALEYQDTPFEKVVDAIQPERSTSHSPIFQTMFSLLNTKPKLPTLPDRSLEMIESHASIAKFDLSVFMAEQEDGLRVSFEYNTDLFDSLTIERMAKHFERWLNELSHHLDIPLAKLGFVLESEKTQLLEDWNCIQTVIPRESTIHELFEQQVKLHPDAVAVVYEKDQLTYRELDERANQLARYLQKQGMEPESLVGLCVERSLEMMVGVLGILKAGGAYVPLDPTYPEQRLQYILADASIQLVVTQESLLESSWLPEEIQAVYLDRDQGEIGKESTALPMVDVKPDHLAYVIYTSGSTGNPKGVMVEHHNVIRLMKATEHWYQFDENDAWTLFHSYAFDFSVWEIWGALLYGGKLVVVPYWISRSPKDFYQLLIEEKVTVLNQTPSAFRQLIQVCGQDESQQLDLRYVIFGGEALEPTSLLPWFERYGDQKPQLINMYGITETAVHVTYHPITLHDAKHASRSNIGKRIPDLEVYVLDGYQQPVPIGVTGELYIGGAGLARGYLNRPELTAERFIPHPFSNDPNMRLYRTGDVARFLSDGNLDYLGRIDHQVKIRGFRIELGEIESALNGHASVKEAVVMVREDQPGDKRLVAYVVGDGDASEWRDYLKAELPSHMIPAGFVKVESIPLTANGKVDRESLPMPEEQKVETEWVAPRSLNEEVLASIWKQVLGIKQVGIHDNFFEIGGDSILSIQIISRASQMGLKLTPKQMFEHQTIAELAQVAKEEQSVQAEQGVVTGEAPLTPIQHWFFEQGHPNLHHWNQSMFVRTKERLDVAALEEAVHTLLTHHDALRFRYEHMSDGAWKQRNEGIESPTTLTVISLDKVPQTEWNQVIQAEIDAAQASLDLHTGPLMKMVYFDEGEQGAGRLFWSIHHLAVDGVSWRILLEDLQTGYNQANRAEQIQLPSKSTSFKEWSEKLHHYAKSEMAPEIRDYWLSQSKQEVSMIPVEATIEHSTNTETEEITVVLDEGKTRSLLQEMSSTHRAQINEILLTALVQATSEWTGHQALTVDLEGHGREEMIEDVDISRTVGWFTSIYPVHLHITGADTPIKALKAVKEQVRQIPNKGVDYGILRYLSPEISECFQSQLTPSISFNYLGQFDQMFSDDAMFTPETEFTSLDHAHGSKRSHLIDVMGMVTDGKLHFTWVYNVGQFTKSTIQHVAENMLLQLNGLIQSSGGEDALTVSDFAIANLTSTDLTKVLSKMSRGKNHPITDLYPLSPLQEGMLFHTLHDQGDEHVAPYMVQLSFQFKGELDLSIFEQAWKSVIQRHDIFRSAFIWDEMEEPLQVVYEQTPFQLNQVDWRSLPVEEQEEKRKAFLLSDRKQTFSFDEAPLMRVTVIQEAEEEYRVVWTHHHILLDGWSLPLVFNELLTVYQQKVQGKTMDLPKSPPYKKYIQWLKEQDQAQAEQFWTEKLKGFTAPTPLILESNEQGRGYAEKGIHVPEEQTQSLQNWAKSNKLTLSTVIQGAWAYLLSRYSGENDIVFGVTSSGRPTEIVDVENIVGPFITTSPTRIRLTDDVKVGEWLQQLQEEEIERRQFEYASLTQIQGWSDVPRGTPLFESLYVFENYPVKEESSGDLEIGDLEGVEQTHYPLGLSVIPGSQLSLKLMYDRSKFHELTMKRMLDHLHLVLQQMMENADQTLSKLVYVTEVEQHQLLVEWNDNAIAYPRESTIHQLFEEQVDRTPDTVAVVDEHQQLTYRELNEKANQLAHFLQKQGVGTESLVGLCFQRSVEMIVSLMGIWKAGAAYVPLDPSYPESRLRYILEDTGLQVLVSNEAVSWTPDEVKIVCLDKDREMISRESTLPPLSDVTGENVAYIIYTSGSTGNPKGVLVQHHSVINLSYGLNKEVFSYETPANLRVSLGSSIAFDASVQELQMLLYGSSVYVISNEVRSDSQQFISFVRKNQLDVLDMTPSLLQSLVDDGLFEDEDVHIPSKVWVGGEAITPSLWEQLVKLDKTQFYNVYGPTECTVDATYFRIDKDSMKVTIGRPLPNIQAYVLDGNLLPVPVGVTGELYLGGAGLARGYLNRPELTDERFISHPFHEGERLYRTGDLVRYLRDGNLEYLGRIDNQVKIRGFRIELGEIEANLERHPLVKEAIVSVREDQPGDQRMVAYVVGEGNAHEWREHLKSLVPGYMIPAHFIEVDSLPLTTNGKVDRKALNRLTIQRENTASVPMIPRDEIEYKLIQIWQDLLQIEDVYINDDFFSRGGHSLLVLKLVSKIRERFGTEMKVSALIENPTVEGIACLIRDNQGTTKSSLTVVPLQESEKQPFFSVHPFLGNVFCYIQLARHLKDHCSFYGLQNPLVEKEKVDELTLSEVVGLYIEEMKHVQPEGPYRLGGWSLGGTIAYEIATELQRRGEEVEMVVLMDTKVPSKEDYTTEETMLSYIWKHFTHLDPTELGEEFLHQQDMLIEQLMAEGVLPQGADLASLQQLANAHRKSLNVMAECTLQPYSGEVIYFSAEEGEELFTDWKPLLQGKVNMFSVPGTHEEIVFSPTVEKVAEHFVNELEKRAQFQQV